MQKVTIFILKDCPFCKKAQKMLSELKSAYPELSGIEVEIIDEAVEPALADCYDYYYVPAFYVNGVKKYEGIVDKSKVENILRSAL